MSSVGHPKSQSCPQEKRARALQAEATALCLRLGGRAFEWVYAVGRARTVSTHHWFQNPFQTSTGLSFAGIHALGEARGCTFCPSLHAARAVRHPSHVSLIAIYPSSVEISSSSFRGSMGEYRAAAA